MITELKDMFEAYAEYNGMTVEEAEELFESGRIGKYDLLEGFLLNEGIIGYTTDIWNIIEIFEEI